MRAATTSNGSSAPFNLVVEANDVQAVPRRHGRLADRAWGQRFKRLFEFRGRLPARDLAQTPTLRRRRTSGVAPRQFGKPLRP